MQSTNRRTIKDNEAERRDQEREDEAGAAAEPLARADAPTLQSRLAHELGPHGRLVPLVDRPESPEPATAPAAPPAARPAPKGRDFRRRLLKTAIGLALAVAVAYVPVRQLFQTASAEAVVNASLVTVRAPIDGIVTGLTGLALGDPMSAGNPILAINNPVADRQRANEARRAIDELAVEQARLEDELAALRAQAEALAVQLDGFRNGRIAILEARLAAGGLPGGEAEATAIELDALRRGLFVGDAYNDKPSTAQRLDAIAIEIAARESLLAAMRSRLLLLVAAETAERRLLEARMSAVVVAPVDGPIWEVLVAPGERVAEGQDLLRVLDCSRPVITAVVSEGAYNRLRPGTAATFTFREGGDPLAGRVVQLSGLAAAPSNFAIQPSALRAESYRVVVSVPSLEAGGSCLIGRTGRVVFNPDDVADLGPAARQAQ